MNAPNPPHRPSVSPRASHVAETPGDTSRDTSRVSQNGGSRDAAVSGDTGDRPVMRNLGGMGHVREHAAAYIGGALLLVAFQALLWVRDHLFKLGVDAVVARQAGDTQRFVLAIVAVAAVAATMQITAALVIQRAAMRILASQRASILERVLSVGMGFVHTMPTGEIVSRGTHDTEQVNRMVGTGILGGLEAALAVVSALAVMLEMSPTLTLASLLPVLTMVVITRSYGQALYPHNHAAQAALGRLGERLHESLSATRVVRALSLEKSELRDLEGDSQTLLARSLSVARLEGIFMPILGVVSASGALIVVWYGGMLVLRGDMTHGQFMAYWAALARLTIPLGMVGLVTSTVQRGRVALVRVNEILQTPSPIVDGPLPPPAVVHGTLEVRGLRYAFDGEHVLHDISLRIERGKSLAVVGPVGGGKSTLARLLARVLPAPRGTIFIDGIDVCDLPVWFVRQTIGYVPQEAFLFSSSIARNIGLALTGADPDESMRHVREAAAEVRMLEVIDGMQRGMATVVGQRGVQLSGGQRQRVAIARTFADDPPIMVLDDPLSAVDATTGKAVLAAIQKRALTKTVLVITSSVATASKCDRIVVIAAGRVFEEGTHAQLKAKNGLYGTLARAQELQQSIGGTPLPGRPRMPEEREP